ncbi:hypothetical protein CYK37_11025 [Mesorhizobium loti]|nr:ABC transporter permease [Mesorhizobium loti]PLP59024.1 hypothetical protein CYK37_11025 [Mesorhizobium loti]
MTRFYGKALLAPLTVFLFVFFLLPMGWFMAYGVRETEIPRALPRTLAVLDGWLAGEPVPATVFAAMAEDMRQAADSGTMADAARRINYELPGVRSAMSKATRTVGRSDAGTSFDSAFFEAINPMLASPAFFSVVKRAGGPLTDHYLLAAVDLKRGPDGALSQAPNENRIYIDVLIRTLSISATVTLCCLLMGFPVAVLLANASEKVADAVLILVLLPFWTSILVRTTAWIVLLQKEGLVNDALIWLGVISEPLAMIFNRTGVVIAMTHVLLPFMILPLFAALKAIPGRYMRAAHSLGAPPMTAFFRVYLPLAVPGIAAGCMMVFILSVGYYVTPSLVGGPGDQMLSTFVATYTTTTGNWGMASSLGFVLLFVTVLLYLVAHRLSGGRAVLPG